MRDCIQGRDWCRGNQGVFSSYDALEGDHKEGERSSVFRLCGFSISSCEGEIHGNIQSDATMRARFSQLLKHDGEILAIDEGRQTDSRDAQYANAKAPSFEILDPASNVNFES
jgi:hypothetical protein